MIGYQILQIIYQTNPYSETQFRKVLMQILLAYEETVKDQVGFRQGRKTNVRVQSLQLAQYI